MDQVRAICRRLLSYIPRRLQAVIDPEDRQVVKEGNMRMRKSKSSPRLVV